MPAHRVVLELLDGEVLQVRGATSAGTFRAYRGLEGAVHGMIAWPNTVLLTGPGNVVVDPGYQTQGDMLVGVLEERGLAPADIPTVVMTHLHSDHLSALPQLGAVALHVHELELDTPWGRRQRGVLDQAEVSVLRGDAGEIAPGLSWVHTPGHAPGHIAVIVETDDERVIVAGDTPGPDPSWLHTLDLPADHPAREEHLASLRRIRALGPALVVPGHTPPARIPAAPG